MTTTSSPLPDPAEGELKEQPPSDLSEYGWDDSDTQRYEGGSGSDAPSDSGGLEAGSELRGAADELARFRELLIETGLVSEQDLLAIRRNLFPDGSSEELRPLSKELIRQGILTPYQAAAVRQGKTRGLVIGNYHILDKIGSGGMGLVLKARDRRQPRTVALKLLPPSISRDRAAVIRFRREAAAVANELGCHVTVLEALDRLMARVVPPLVSDFFLGLHREYGVDVRLGAVVASIESRHPLKSPCSGEPGFRRRIARIWKDSPVRSAVLKPRIISSRKRPP